MKKEIKLSNKVYSKDFSVKAMGYSCEEVDSFFDEVNIEIGKLERELERIKGDLEREKANYTAEKQKADSLYLQFTQLKAQGGNTVNNNASFNNIELFNRIANIEKMLKKLQDDKNKS